MIQNSLQSWKCSLTVSPARSVLMSYFETSLQVGNSAPSRKVSEWENVQSAASKDSTTYPLPLISGGSFDLNDPLAIAEILGSSCCSSQKAGLFSGLRLGAISSDL